MRLATLDLGSNSFHLVVVEKNDGQEPRVLLRERELVRLGEGTLIQGRIPPELLARAQAAILRLHAAARELAPEVITAVATSAVREASNRDDLLATASELGISVRVLSGDQEAELVFSGARAWLGPEPSRVVVFDMGGGSLEVALGDAGRPVFTASLPLGVLRMSQLHPLVWPAPPEALRPIEARARDILRPAVDRVRELGFDAVVLTSGTALTLGALFVGQRRARPRSLQRAWIQNLAEELAAESLEQRLQRPGMDGRRADIIVHGAAVLTAVLDECRVSDALLCPAALREGVILQMLDGSRPPQW